jgi:hypothetical protein
MSSLSAAVTRLATPAVHWIALLALCSACVEGGLAKLFDFEGAIAEIAESQPQAVVKLIEQAAKGTE